MKNDFKEDIPGFPAGDDKGKDGSATTEKKRGALSQWTENLIQMGLGESILRVGTHGLSIAGIIIVIALARMYLNQSPNSLVRGAQAQGPTATPAVEVESMPAVENISTSGILRGANIHTIVPSRPRQEIVNYTVQKGDTIVGIADKYSLQPKTIFGANYDVLQDNPDNLQPDQSIKILPVDGVYWEWLGGIQFGGWAAYFKVKPEDIINYPANHLDAATIGDPANANIPKNTWLIIPGGYYQYHKPGQDTWGITRNTPASAQVGGSGTCGAITGGNVGWGTFVYPTPKHVLSGYDYSEKSNHLGIDLMGNEGDSVYAADSGVIVYAGPNSYGYGNMIMIDHGTGFQTLYAHLSQIFVECGQSVNQGQTIGAVGSTGHSSGPHLHFEVRTASTVTNPWDVLPPP
jgi:murein DD-endopeptidase MepM/ murein hydrolase activator NlpD